MIIMMISFITVSFFILFIIYVIDWVTHRQMTKDFCNYYDEGNFKKFLKEFRKRKWVIDPKFPDSLFGKEKDRNEIHASIISFNGKGMVLPFISYLKFKRYTNKILKEENEKRKVKWN